MENVFQALGAVLNPEVSKMEIELTSVESKINNLEAKENGGYTARLAKSFPLGMVGGSGRNTARLNKIRENELDRTIDRAKELVELYKRKNYLVAQIEYIKSGKREQDKLKKEKLNASLAEYWKNLKRGDIIDIGGNSPVTITKKNAKSIETGSGCKWTAAEIIGKAAAALI